MNAAAERLGVSQTLDAAAAAAVMGRARAAVAADEGDDPLLVRNIE